MHRRSDSARFFALNLEICAPRAYGNSRIPREKKPTRQFAELLLDLRLGTNKNIPRVPLPIPPFAFRGNFNNFRKCSRVWAIGLIFPKFSLKYTFRWINFPRSPRKSLPLAIEKGASPSPAPSLAIRARRPTAPVARPPTLNRTHSSVPPSACQGPRTRRATHTAVVYGRAVEASGCVVRLQTQCQSRGVFEARRPGERRRPARRTKRRPRVCEI